MKKLRLGDELVLLVFFLLFPLGTEYIISLTREKTKRKMMNLRYGNQSRNERKKPKFAVLTLINKSVKILKEIMTRNILFI